MRKREPSQMPSLRKFRTELHVHTVVSPCAEVEMIPPLIVQEALEKHIDIIAITDHNTTANAAAVMKAAQGTNLTVLPGMELQTAEDVHSLCIFPDLDRALDFQKLVDLTLPDMKNSPEHLGEQFIVDETGDYIRREDRLLIISTGMSLTSAWQKVTTLGGLFIPAHVDRKAFGLLENLGFVPQDIHPDALEISRHQNSTSAATVYPQLTGYPLVKGGDVHRLEEFLGANILEMASPTLEEIRLALLHENGRTVKIDD